MGVGGRFLHIIFQLESSSTARLQQAGLFLGRWEGGGGAWWGNLKYETGYVLKPRKTVNWGVTKGLISALPGFSAGLGQSVKCFSRLEAGTAGHSCPCGRGPGLSLAPAEGKERSCARVTVPFRKAACTACDRPWEHAAGGVAAWQDRAGIACARPSSPRSPLHRRAPGWARKCKSFKALGPTCYVAFATAVRAGLELRHAV